MRFYLFILVLATALVACKSSEYDTTKSGVKYKIYTKEKGNKVKAGDAVTLNVSEVLLRAGAKDSSLFTAPIRMRVAPTAKTDSYLKRSINDVLEMMAKGDSASFLVPVDSMKPEEKDPSFKKGESVRYNIKIKEVIEKTAYEKEMHEEGIKAAQMIRDYTENAKKEHADVAKKDSAAIEGWIKSHNVNAMRTPSGLAYIISGEGAGDNLLPGQLASVKYTGKLLDGTVFDASNDHPIQVQMGYGKVILGWEEGLMHFKKGGKGMLLIPSYLAYGDKGQGKIPANSPLIFEIEIVDVK